MRLGRTPTTGPRHPFRAPLGYAPGKLSLGYQPVEILGISPWRQQPVSNHTSTVGSLQDSEPLFRRPSHCARNFNEVKRPKIRPLIKPDCLCRVCD